MRRKKASELFPLVPNEVLGPARSPGGKQNLFAMFPSQTHHLPFKARPCLGSSYRAGCAPQRWGQRCQEGCFQ